MRADSAAASRGETHASDVRLCARLGAAWQLTTDEQSAVLGVSTPTFLQWIIGAVAQDVAQAVSVRLGHLIAIDLACHAFYGPGSALARDAVRRAGTAPDGVGAAFSLLSGDLAVLIAVRQIFEARAGGAHILTVAPLLTRRDDA